MITEIVKSKHFANSLYLITEQFVKMGLGLLVGLYIVRHLGPVEYGEYSYLLSVAAITGSVSRLGFDGVVLRLISEKPELKIAILTSSSLCLIVAATINVVVLVLVSFFDKTELSGWLYFTLGFSLFFQATSIVDWRAQLDTKSKLGAWARTSASLVSNTARILAIYYDGGVNVFVVLFVVESFISAILIVFLAKKYNLAGFFSYSSASLELSWICIKSSFPMMLTLASANIYGKLDQVIIMDKFGAEMAGSYAAIIKISESWIVLPFVLVTQLIPSLIRSRSIGFTEYFGKVVSIYRLIGGASALFCLLVSFFATEIVLYGFGKDYVSAIIFVPFVMINTFLLSIISCNTRILISEGREWQVAMRALTVMTVCVVGWIFFIPMYGVFGAIFTCTLGLLFSAFVADFVFRDTPRILLNAKLKAIGFGVIK